MREFTLWDWERITEYRRMRELAEKFPKIIRMKHMVTNNVFRAVLEVRNARDGEWMVDYGQSQLGPWFFQKIREEKHGSHY